MNEAYIFPRPLLGTESFEFTVKKLEIFQVEFAACVRVKWLKLNA